MISMIQRVWEFDPDTESRRFFGWPENMLVVTAEQTKRDDQDSTMTVCSGCGVSRG